MTLRLVRLVVKEDCREEALRILEEHDVSTRWVLPGSDGLVVIEMVLSREGNEPILDSLEDRFRDRETFRLLFMPLQAIVPRMDEPDESSEEGETETTEAEEGSRVPARINREELYADLRDSSRTTPYYLVMVALSAVVACAGLRLGDGAVIIGAMVIAPLIGPNLGVAFATTLGDLKLGRGALLASMAGALTALGVALLAGVLFGVDPAGSEVLARTRLTYDNLALALAAGAAGAISLTRGVGTGLVGVMVAVALLPPLANAGLLLGGGYGELGGGALLLVVGNVVCINLAATAAFLIQGIRPNTWWDEGTRKRAVWAASALWTLLFLGLVVVIWLTWDAEASPGIFR